MLAAAAGLVIGGVHRQVWRHIGAPDAIRLVQGIALAVVLYLPVMVALNGRLLGPGAGPARRHRSCGPPRLSPAAWSRATAPPTPPSASSSASPATARPCCWSAIPTSWIEVLRRIEASGDGATLRVLGLIEVDAKEPGRAVRGLPIMGSLRNLGEIIDILTLRYGATPWIAVTGPARERATMNRGARDRLRPRRPYHVTRP